MYSVLFFPYFGASDMNSQIVKKVLFVAAVALAAGFVARRVAAMNLPVVSGIAAQVVS